MSFSHEFAINQDATKSPRNGDGDFEFFVRDPAENKISPADELFLNGKLVPLQITSKNDEDERYVDNEEEKECEKIVINEIFEKGNSASPKAPKCSWKEFLGLRRSNIPKSDTKYSKSLKFFRSKSSSSSSSPSMNLPLLKDVDEEAELVSTSSRLSLSSSSSGADHEDLPRLSLDSEKPKLSKLKLTPIRPRVQKSQTRQNLRTGRTSRRTPPDSTTSSRGVSLDSPRMNASGKIVFQGLERSSSSPSSFNGGPRLKARGMERSYSANVNVRIRPVLNVPVCSLRGSKSGSVFGFGQLFSSHKKDGGGSKNQGIKRNGSGSNR